MAETILGLADDVQSPEAAHRLAYTGILYSETRQRLGDLPGALAAAERAAEHARLSGRPSIVAIAHHALGNRLRRGGDFAGAEARFREALEAEGGARIAAHCLSDLAIVIGEQRGFAAASPVIDKAVAALPTDPPELALELEVRKAEGWVHTYLPEHVERAVAAFERAHELAIQMNRPRPAAFALGHRGIVRYVMQDRPQEALADLGVAIDEAVRQGDGFQERAFRLERAIASLHLGRLDDTESDLAVVREDPPPGERGVRLAACGAGLALLRGRHPALPEGVRERVPELVVLTEAARADRAEARAMLEGYTSPTEPWARPLVEPVEAHVRAWVEAWVAHPEGAWIEDPDGVRHDFTAVARHPALVRALVEARLRHPGEGLGADALVAAGWPGEVVLERAASTRIRVALSALRKAGLRPLLLRGGGGWFLDPEVPLRVDASDRGGAAGEFQGEPARSGVRTTD